MLVEAEKKVASILNAQFRNAIASYRRGETGRDRLEKRVFYNLLSDIHDIYFRNPEFIRAVADRTGLSAADAELFFTCTVNALVQLAKENMEKK